MPCLPAFLPRLVAAVLCASLTGCALLRPSADDTAAAAPDAAAGAWAGVEAPADAARAPAWEHMTFPGKAPTQFSYVRKDGREAVAAVAKSSASMKRLRLDVPPEALGALRFSWKVPALIQQADMGRRDREDSAVRIVLVFDGDRSRLSPGDNLLSEVARTLTGEEMPYATLMYVWCNRRAPGEVIVNPRTSRIRKLVVESGSTNLGRWMDYERDIRADYIRAFGEPPGPLRGVALMTDSDNTRSLARAWYGPVRLSSSAASYGQ
ncbi:MAG: hypothetical protein RL513_1227 [Pseudomonadota bacterium]|jgi:hypothetical protein